MPIPQFTKRSYGFNDRVDTPAPVHDNPRKPGGRKWWKILLFPFWLIYRIFVLFGRIWKHRPRLSKQHRTEFRRKLIWFLVFITVIGFLATTIMVAWASKDLPDPDKLTDRRVAQSTKIYDRTGKTLLYEIFADEKRTLVDLSEIPKDLINGVIATEDTEFYQHKGIRPLSILRAIIYGIFTSKRISGTSTLTQQLVKNAILTDERSYTRKIKEAILSIRLEQKYTKDQILKIYFNEIPYGSTNYGAEAAAQSYFGKHVSELNLQECATLAGLPQSPTRYLNDSVALLQRRDFVLRRMFEEGYITEEQKNSAQNEPLTLSRHFGDIKAPHFVLYIKELLVNQFGEQMVDSGGLQVITSLDWDKQQIAEKVFMEKGDKILAEAGANNLALVAMDPKNGEVLAMIGSKDFYNDEIDGQFNVATLGRRQPGSSFKPIIYAATFEKGYTPETILYDVNTDFATNGESYIPHDFDHKERGPVTIRQALQGSLNIPAVKALYLVGPKKGIEFSEQMGYTTLSEGNFGLSLVLGGGEVKLLEHTAAFAVFANNGIYHKPVSILKIEDNQNNILFEQKPDAGKKILAPEITALISNVLSDDSARAYMFGTGSVLTLPNRPAAAKTGTTNDYVDSWTMGYTPSLVTGVWGGNTDNKSMKAGYGGTMLAAPIWHDFMAEALKNTSVENFPTPPANTADKPVLRGSTGGSITLLVNKVSGRLASSSTPENLIEERTYIQPHDILHYVNKDDPRGPAPTNPADDPQYLVWENAIQDWITRQKEKDPNWNINFSDPPTLYDDEYSIEMMPTLTVNAPLPSSTLYSRQITTDIKVSATRGVSRVMYKIDDRNVGAIKQYPFNLNYFARDLVSGSHILNIVVEDDIGNRREENIPFILSATEEQPGVFWTETNQSISLSSFPKSFYLDHYRLNEIKNIIISAQKDGDKIIIANISDFSNLFNDQIVVSWNTPPSTGSWNLIAEVELKNGTVTESDQLVINVQ